MDANAPSLLMRMPSLVVPYARRTNPRIREDLAHQQQKAAFVLGGETGAVLLAIMGMAVSPDTLLRFIRKAPEAEMKTLRVLGVDDWVRFVPSKQAITWG